MDLYFRFIIALLVVLGLIAGLAYLVRRFGPRNLMAAPGGRTRRLNVVEVANLDPRRRLVLVRRDNVEHLLLLGATGDIVVETCFSGPAAAIAAADAKP